MQILKAST